MEQQEKTIEAIAEELSADCGMSCMDEKTIQAANLLIEFALEVEYNDTRFPPKDLNRAADILEDYLNS